jgi:predicted amidohydrolase YtcJ
VHTVGDFAIKATIDAFISAMQKYPRENPRHYVIHAEGLGDYEDFQRAAKFGIGVSVQPTFGNILFEASIACVGEKCERAFNVRDLLSLGCWAAGGSDAIAGEYDHWRKGVQAAVTRRSIVTGKVYSPELALTVEEAVRLFTAGGAYQESKENSRGSIEPGKVADFQVLDRDIFEVPHEEIAGINVVMTMLGGKVVYERNND